MTESTFRVIIGGGGISGLTLANSLEKAGIDYILLEGRNEIAPRVGASIGIFPNGSRILDQLGCFGHIEKVITPLTNYHSRYKNGDLIYTNDGAKLSAARFSYPATFLERETVLRILYNNLSDKSKVKTGKRISKVDHNAKEVIVVCEDGTAISGDILVGCDGIHSKVRDELWRISQITEPEAIDPKDKEVLLAEYNCLFGISKPTPGITPGEIDVNHNEGISTMVIGGKEKVFWFIFKQLDKVYKVPNIPRYSHSDADTFAEKIQDMPIKSGVTFGNIWKNRDTYTLVPLEEAQLKRWSWGRIACVGDNVHKMTPNMGAGGNSAMETSAALANEIKAMVGNAEKGKPSFDTIKSHLGNYQKTREQRISAIWKAANGLTRIHALKTLNDKFLAYWVLPTAGDTFTNMNCDMVLGSVKLDFLPVPERSTQGTMPFNPSQGLGQFESRLVRAAKALPFLALSATAYYYMVGIALPPAITRPVEILSEGVQSVMGKPGSVQIPQIFYGVEFIDSRFRSLVACFASSQFADVISNWQTFNFLTELGILYAIMLIEGARRANVMTLASVPLLFGYNMQFHTIGVVMALYCFVHYITSPVESFRARDFRLTDMAYTGSVLPVLILCHYIPNYLSFASWMEPQARSSWNWIWQLFPVYVSILQFLLKKTIMPNTVQKDRIHKTNADMWTIKYTIGSLCAFSTLTWWYTLYSAPVSWSTLLIPNLAAGQPGDASIRMLFQCDEVFSMTASYLWLLYLYRDMKQAGMMDDSWIGIVLKGVLSLITLGPGATVGLGWLYREQLLATRWHKDALVLGKAWTAAT